MGNKSTKNWKSSPPQQLIQISIRAYQLFSEGLAILNPYLKIYLKKYHGLYECLGSTETVYNCNSPTFKQTFTIAFEMTEIQDLKIVVFHEDFQQIDTEIGLMQIKLSSLVLNQNQILTENIFNQASFQSKGKLMLSPKILHSKQQHFHLRWSLHNLNFQLFPSKNSQPKYLKLSTVDDKGTVKQIGKSVMKNSVTKNQIIRLQKCKQSDKLLKMQVFSLSLTKNKSEKIIGQCLVFKDQLINKKSDQMCSYALFNPKIQAQFGNLVIQEFRKQETKNLLYYLQKGLELNVSVAIDFTCSNGNPKITTSKHYLSFQMNSYQFALKAVSDVLQSYQNQIQAFGFGAIIPSFSSQSDKTSEVSHCFPLRNQQKSEVFHNFQDLMRTYERTVKEIQFDGPTLLSPSLEHIIKKLIKKEGKSSYQIHIILTDGDIADQEIQNVLHLLSAHSYLPLSIILIGIGLNSKEKIQKLVRLDNDEHQQANIKGRDMIQFVNFQEFKHDSFLLSREITCEIPTQIQEYFAANNFDMKEALNKQCFHQYDENIQEKYANRIPKRFTTHSIDARLQKDSKQKENTPKS